MLRTCIYFKTLLQAIMLRKWSLQSRVDQVTKRTSSNITSVCFKAMLVALFASIRHVFWPFLPLALQSARRAGEEILAPSLSSPATALTTEISSCASACECGSSRTVVKANGDESCFAPRGFCSSTKPRPCLGSQEAVQKTFFLLTSPKAQWVSRSTFAFLRAHARPSASKPHVERVMRFGEM